MNSTCHILGLGYAVPDTVLTNLDIERLVETNHEWIVSRTGISERRIVKEGETSATLSHLAAEKALANAGLKAEDLTHLLVATFTPDAYIPSTACLVEHRLGISGRMAMDISAACSGFLYGLETARAIVTLHPEAVVLVAGTDVISSRVNYADRGTCILFGDGAGAAIVTGAGHPGGALVQDVMLSSDGGLGELLTVKGGGSCMPYKLGEPVREDFFVQMQGRDVFKHAVRSMSAICEAMLVKHGLTNDQVDVFIPHQANMRIIEGVAKKMNMPEEKVFTNLQRYGNTSAASVIIALSEARATGVIKDGNRVLLGTFGGGFTWGSALVQF
jgi:3-oxoacyl-[acyl-carrier-protein] synthase-3